MQNHLGRVKNFDISPESNVRVLEETELTLGYDMKNCLKEEEN